MTETCSICGRKLKRVKHLSDGRVAGVVCAAKLGKLTKAPRQPAKNPKFSAPEIERCPLTLDMFEVNDG